VRPLVLAAVMLVTPAWALSPEAQEFMTISKQLEPVHCEKRKLRREMAMAQGEGRDPAPFRAQFDKLNRNAQTAKLEKRLAQLEPKVLHSKDPEDLQAISLQQREAFYRCD